MLRIKAIITLILLALSIFGMTAKEFVVVIDPGHGGHDYGAVGKITNEKSINLAVAKKLGEKIESGMTDVKVVFTRKTDVFISLKERANIANRAKGDLFISIHVNSVDKRSKNRTTVAGSEVYTLGLHKSEENLAVAKRENSVMALEEDYSETYKGFDPNSIESYIIFELSQSKHLEQSIDFAGTAVCELSSTAGRVNKGVKQAGFWVLWATGMPSVLIELDFICNPASEKFMASERGQQKLANALYNAFATYRGLQPENDTKQNRQEKNDTPQGKPDKSSDPEPVKSADTDTGTDFRVQILASDRQLQPTSPQFKGINETIEEYYDRGLYKYTVGHAVTFEAAKPLQRRLRTKFPQAFIIKMVDGKRAY